MLIVLTRILTKEQERWVLVIGKTGYTWTEKT